MPNDSIEFIEEKTISVKVPETDEEALVILPECGGHGMYNILREFGAPVIKAYLCVLHNIVGEYKESHAIMDEYGVPHPETPKQD